MPERIQLKRTKGWRLPEGVIVVTRPGPWGNRFVVCRDKTFWWCMLSRDNGIPFVTEAAARRQSIKLYCEEMSGEAVEAAQKLLRGHDLACWCRAAPEGVPSALWCHADMLIEIANT